MGPASVPSNTMWYQISVKLGYLKADLFGRETTEETQEFLNALASACARHKCSRVLISVRCSKSVFTVEKYGLFSYFDRASESSLKIALLGDSDELRIAHQYIESLALQRGVDLRAFRDEGAALKWLSSGAREPEHRLGVMRKI
jgi:hypothetical protein